METKAKGKASRLGGLGGGMVLEEEWGGTEVMRNSRQT